MRIQEFLSCHEKFELLIRHPNGDVMKACRYMSLKLSRDVGWRKKHGSHEYVVVFECKRQDGNTSGASMLGNSHGMNCDGRQGPPSTEKIENARHSLSLTPGNPDMGNDLGSVNPRPPVQDFESEASVAKKQGTVLNSFCAGS